MNSKHCDHPNHNHAVCKHLNAASSYGIKHFTGTGLDFELLCEECATTTDHPLLQLCDNCFVSIENNADWRFEGSPAITHKPQAFTFTTDTFSLNSLNKAEILATAPLLNSQGNWLLFTDNNELIELDTSNKTSTVVAILNEGLICLTGEIQLCVSDDACYAAITSNVHTSDEEPASHTGWVISLKSQLPILKLECGDYHTENTTYPLRFISHQGKTLLIHATEWDRLDITDLSTLKFVTERNYTDKPDDWQENDDAFSEWNGSLLVSPDNQWVATIGWVWHPLGTAYTWNLQTWLNDNVWEADYGLSKRKFCSWEYFWQNPFCWVDNTTLCIWGYESFVNAEDIPRNSVALYDVSSGELIRWFPGPSMDVFFFDDYLFSGSADPVVNPETPSEKTLTVWDINDGSLLHQEENLSPIDYHPVAKTFLSISDKNEITITHWLKK